MFMVGKSLPDYGTNVIGFGGSGCPSNHPWSCCSSVLFMFVGTSLLSTLSHPWSCATVLCDELVEFVEALGGG